VSGGRPVAEPAATRRRPALKHADGRWRCAWCGTDPLYVHYHDTEWGVPVRDDGRLFEMLCLEGAQAGLSWITVLRKRDHYRRVFDGFDAAKMAHYTARRQEELLQDPGIVRNQLKVRGFVTNARAYLELAEAGGSLAELVWAHRPRGRRRRPRDLSDIAVSTPESDALSKELKRRGFTFVGSTICYAFMQAVGIVDDHQGRCVAAAGRAGAISP
jgi:DNA-3-methyladenine glycosylase I